MSLETGRWTESEHQRFLQGLNLFGRKWTKVAEVVGTRSTSQVRSHAQKYFAKLGKVRNQGGGGVVRYVPLLSLECLEYFSGLRFSSLSPFLPSRGA